MDIAVIKEKLGSDWTSAIGLIRSALESDIDLLNLTNDRILSNSGKQLRPMLTLLMGRACSSGGVLTEATCRYAAAAELLHNATLLHDDVADGSDKRRGVPTINSLMGPEVSVLVGDYWLVKTMDVILGTDDADSHVIRIFSKTLSDLAQGEMFQLQKAGSGDTSMDDYLRVIYSKTASLFEAACVSAAVSVSAPEHLVDAARDYAVSLGLAFQIKDDILDYSGDSNVGKPLGVDILEQKITAPLLCAFSNVGKQEENAVRELVREIPTHPEHRERVVSFVRENGGLEKSRQMLNDYMYRAVSALEAIGPSFEKDALTQLAHYVASRNK